MNNKQFSKDLNANGFSYEKQMVLFHRVEASTLRALHEGYLKGLLLEDESATRAVVKLMAEQLNLVYEDNGLEVRLGSQIAGSIYLYNPLVGGFTLTCPDSYIPTMITAVGSAIESVGELKLNDIIENMSRSKAAFKQFDGGKLTAIVRKVTTHSKTLGGLLPGKPLAEPLEDSHEITEVLLYSTYDDDVMDLVREFRNTSKQAISTNLDFDLELLCL